MEDKNADFGNWVSGSDGFYTPRGDYAVVVEEGVELGAYMAQAVVVPWSVLRALAEAAVAAQGNEDT